MLQDDGTDCLITSLFLVLNKTALFSAAYSWLELVFRHCKLKFDPHHISSTLFSLYFTDNDALAEPTMSTRHDYRKVERTTVEPRYSNVRRFCTRSRCLKKTINKCTVEEISSLKGF